MICEERLCVGDVTLGGGLVLERSVTKLRHSDRCSPELRWRTDKFLLPFYVVLCSVCAMKMERKRRNSCKICVFSLFLGNPRERAYGEDQNFTPCAGRANLGHDSIRSIDTIVGLKI
ncbi:hypothetical protein CFOL_v3_06090 [Cephalotus follicularis]|uniref:Uncharacterized protein n=1 Tax=Cephalotus follicularis TaxID=3775 RepID=A0A1Q3B3J6_CEPFO|nr:hypothetical protein CFOL_v3_06090 [Cephalotus follicularis]